MAQKTILTHEMQAAVAQAPINLSDASIGKYFRNEAEIGDVQEVVLRVRERDNPISIGLTGSRTEGRLFYTAEQLAAKLLLFGQAAVLGIVSGEQRGMLAFQGIPDSVVERVEPLAKWLKEASERAVNLEDIDLMKLPEALGV